MTTSEEMRLGKEGGLPPFTPLVKTLLCNVDIYELSKHRVSLLSWTLYRAVQEVGEGHYNIHISQLSTRVQFTEFNPITDTSQLATQAVNQVNKGLPPSQTVIRLVGWGGRGPPTRPQTND